MPCIIIFSYRDNLESGLNGSSKGKIILFPKLIALFTENILRSLSVDDSPNVLFRLIPQLIILSQHIFPRHGAICGHKTNSAFMLFISVTQPLSSIATIL